MKQALIKLVNAIIRHIEEHPDTLPTEHGIRMWLAQQGYNKRDIDAVIKLVRPQFQNRMMATSIPRTVARPFSTDELMKMTNDARDALTRLERLGLINDYEREMVLERLTHFDAPVGLDELDYLLAWVVYSAKDYETQQTIFSVLEGHQDTYH